MSGARRLALLALGATALLTGGRALGADDGRFALVVGHNLGDADEPPLRYAERDAERVYEALTGLGDFPPHQVVLLRGARPDAVRAALIDLNARLRGVEGSERVLTVYFSGHGDSEYLHLGGERLAIRELERLVVGSAASFRLLVLDACRSGGLTRVKGGVPAPPLGQPTHISHRSAGEGAVFLTSTAAGEDAQESDALRGSFFTHHFVSGLMGAADRDRDGAVTLAEVYRYAYDATLRSTSRTLAGTQHPTFKYDFKGRGEVVLTRPLQRRTDRALLTLPDGWSWLLMRESAEGEVAAEVASGARSRTLSLPAGRYFARGRGVESLLEGELVVAGGRSQVLDTTSLERIAYARLVRKGGAGLAAVAGPIAGYAFRTSLYDGGDLCHGGFVGGLWELSEVSLSTRLDFCRGGFENPQLQARSHELALALGVGRALDLPVLTLTLQARLGASWLQQRFEPAEVAATRNSAAAHLALGAGLGFDLVGGLHLLIEAEATLHLMSREGLTDTALEAVPAFRASLGLGWRL